MKRDAQPALRTAPALGPAGGAACAALLARVRRQPHAEALRARTGAGWSAWTSTQFAARVGGLARGFARLGVPPGGRIHVLSPLSPDFVALLFAADALGVTLDFGAPPEADAGPVYAWAEGEHDVEHWLQRPRAAASLVVTAQRQAGVALPPGAGAPVRIVDLASLLADDPGTPPHADALSSAWTPRPLPVPATRLLADFAADWLPGLQFLRHGWPAGDATLALPEPDGDAAADRRAAAAGLWIADGPALQRLLAEAQARTPATGLAGALLRGWTEGRARPLAALWRPRVRAALGLAGVRGVLTSGAPGVRPLLLSLGLGHWPLPLGPAAGVPAATPGTAGPAPLAPRSGAADPAPAAWGLSS